MNILHQIRKLTYVKGIRILINGIWKTFLLVEPVVSVLITFPAFALNGKARAKIITIKQSVSALPIDVSFKPSLPMELRLYLLNGFLKHFIMFPLSIKDKASLFQS